MSAEARQRIAEGLRRSAQAKAMARAAQGAAPALQGSARAPADELAEVSAPETTVEVLADAPVVVSAPEEPDEAPADVPVPDSPRGSRATRKGARAGHYPSGDALPHPGQYGRWRRPGFPRLPCSPDT